MSMSMSMSMRQLAFRAAPKKGGEVTPVCLPLSGAASPRVRAAAQTTTNVEYRIGPRGPGGGVMNKLLRPHLTRSIPARNRVCELMGGIIDVP